VASNFFVVVTARFRLLCVVVMIEPGTRSILHHNVVAAHPTADWTLQQFRSRRTHHEYSLEKAA
jgi:hypothetical protein